MPGRLAIFDDNKFKEDISVFIKSDLIETLKPRYNIPPTTAIPVFLNDGHYIYCHFGYIPSWANSKASMNINARSETIYEKKTFRESFRFRRCIIPINGFYEWKIEEKEKTPYFVKDVNNDYFAVAGIWDEFFDKELNMNIITVALITCDANEKLSNVHPRMPVILEKKDYSTWLYSSDLSEINSLFKIYPSEKIELYEVTTNVNKVLFDEKSCIKKINKIQENKVGQLSLF